MFCVNCGTQIPDNTKFCPNCGCKNDGIEIDPAAFSEKSNSERTENGRSTGEKNGSTITISLNTSPMQVILTILAFAGAAYFLYETLTGIGGIFQSLSGMFSYYNKIPYIFLAVANIIRTLAGVVMVMVLVTFGLYRKPANMRSLFTAVNAGAILYILLHFLQIIFNCIAYTLMYGYAWFDTYNLLRYIAIGLAVMAIGLVLLLADGYRLYAGKTGNDIPVILQRTMEDFSSAWKSSKGSNSGKAERQNGRKQTYRGSSNQNFNGNPGMAGNSGMGTNPGMMGNQPYPNPAGGVRVKSDRSFLLYILLNCVTCGIYSLVFLHGLARDVNIMCEGDGRKTNGLLLLIVFSLLTCGIYSYVWYYQLANRIQSNAPRYGIYIKENGSTFLLWTLVGLLLCGIGPFIAMYNIFKASNELASAYNRANGYMY